MLRKLIADMKMDTLEGDAMRTLAMMRAELVRQGLGRQVALDQELAIGVQ